MAGLCSGRTPTGTPGRSRGAEERGTLPAPTPGYGSAGRSGSRPPLPRDWVDDRPPRVSSGRSPNAVQPANEIGNDPWSDGYRHHADVVPVGGRVRLACLVPVRVISLVLDGDTYLYGASLRGPLLMVPRLPKVALTPADTPSWLYEPGIDTTHTVRATVNIGDGRYRTRCANPKTVSNLGLDVVTLR
jgi:hypothetical protein